MKKSIIPIITAFLLFLFFTLCFAQTPLKVTFIDVGHGDCILIQTPDDGKKGNGKYEGNIILIDGGEYKEGNKVIIPYLKSHGVPQNSSIDYLILTHAHSDHLGGLIPVIENYNIKAILDPGYDPPQNIRKNNIGDGEKKKRTGYPEFLKLAREEKNCKFYRPLIGTVIKKEGDTLNWGSELQVRVLNSKKVAKDPNNTSIVIRLQYGEVGFLLVGDAEGKERKDSADVLKFVEKDLVNEYGNALKSTFLKAGHHGSESSSTNAFIDAVSPQYVIICVGNKKFSGTLLPDKSVLGRYEKRHIKIYRTDRDDESKDSAETSGDDHIVITTDGTLMGTKIDYYSG
ncbi:MAG: MBL fold metallo-hydrolase [Candidatus Omnitrophota bacterium]